jgi:hypothetical protein
MLLFIAALDIAGLRGKSDSPDIMYWKGETIRTINARLGDSKKMATDGTIAAVASLAHLEVKFDPFDFHPLLKLIPASESIRNRRNGCNTCNWFGSSC